MMRKLYILPFLLLAVSGFGQNKKGLLRKGDARFEALAYSKALPFYLKYAEANPGNVDAILKVGDCYRMINDPENAEKWYSEGVNGAPQIYRYYYASALMQNEKFSEAADQFRTYLTANPGREIARVRLGSCMEYRKFYADSGRFVLRNEGINTEKAEFSPMPFGEKVVISSNRQGENWLFSWLNNPFLDLYESEVGGDRELETPVPLKGLVNSKFHEASATFTPTGDTLFFTRNNFYKGKTNHSKEGTLLLQTYVSYRKGKRWSKIKSVDFNNDEYSTGHPALFDGGNKMIIASDMPGSEGGTDLFIVERQGNGWSEPLNLGEALNTEGNEMFPWVSSDGTLFFASNGLEGLGGLDVYMAKQTGDGTWGAPVNLGYPVNTTLDDFGLVLTEDGTTGYLASNRKGGQGDDDIYSFNIQKQVILHVTDAVTGKPIENALAKSYVEGTALGYTMTDEVGKSKLYTTGNYSYLLNITRDNYEKKEVAFTPGSGNPFEPYIVEAKLNPSKPIQDCPPYVTIQGEILTNNTVLPPDAKVTIRDKKTGLTITPDLHFTTTANLGKDYEIELTGEGLEPIRYDLSTAKADPYDTLDIKVELSAANIGKVFYIIYYNYDKHDIRRDASEELDRVVTFMRSNPSTQVELSSHTDSRGTTAYNENLSKNRAIEAYTYLVKKGIDKSRITYKWFGENQLTNGCKDNSPCNEEQHQLNRRTEFKLIGF